MKILIVEDEPSLREIMYRALVQEHYVVETAATYAEADAKVAGYSYDCILLDIMLPGEDGITILKKLREKTGTTQRQLAEAIGVSQQSVNKYENHNIEPDIETLVRIADYFAVSVDTVIGHAEDDGELTESERLLLQKYRRLTPKRRAAVDALLDCF